MVPMIILSLLKQFIRVYNVTICDTYKNYVFMYINTIIYNIEQIYNV